MNDVLVSIKDVLPDAIFQAQFWADFSSRAISASVGAGVGALIGAKSAFGLERRKAQEDRELAAKAAAAILADQHTTSGNMAILTLAMISNDLVSYRTQVLEPVKKIVSPWFWLAPTDVSEASFHTFDIQSLSFLVNTKNPGILLKLSIEADRHRALLKAIQVRSLFHQEHLIPLLERLERDRPGMNYTDIELREAVGKRIYFTLDNYFSDIRTLWGLNFKTARETADELHALLVETLPGKKFIDFDKDGENAAFGMSLVEVRKTSRGSESAPDTSNGNQI